MLDAPGGTKQDIIDTARDMFGRHGYDGTSIRQLTSSLGITPAALYYHFGSKHEVLEGIMAGFIEGGERLLEGLRKLGRGPDTIRPAFEGYYDLLASDIGVFRLVFNDAAIQSGAIGQRIRVQAREFFGHLVGNEPTVEDRIRAAAAVGTIRLSLEQPGVEPPVHRARIVNRAMLLMED
ncbi:MAG: helix-turn-helix domain containing protein [Actinomycetota bacterium]|nr:helix-turn-helix domain containing protein [Actinomycetota bacterium]